MKHNVKLTISAFPNNNDKIDYNTTAINNLI